VQMFGTFFCATRYNGLKLCLDLIKSFQVQALGTDASQHIQRVCCEKVVIYGWIT